MQTVEFSRQRLLTEAGNIILLVASHATDGEIGFANGVKATVDWLVFGKIPPTSALRRLMGAAG